MFIPFFLALKQAGVPVTLREYLSLLAALQTGIADFDVEAFYFLARAALVKDERHIDRFDRVFAASFADWKPCPARRTHRRRSICRKTGCASCSKRR